MAQRKKSSSDRVAKTLAALKRNGVEYVRFEVSDLHGTARSKQVPITWFESYARKGLNMYGGVIGLDTASNVVPGSLYNEQVNYRDKYLFPDFATLAPVPWLDNTAKLICDPVWEPGAPLKAAPRYVVRQLLDKVDKLGFKAVMAHEYEFYVLDQETHEPLFGGPHIFNNTRNEMIPVVRELTDYLRAAGFDMMTVNVEYAPSQFELVYGPAEGIAGADTGFTFKNAVKEIVHHGGYHATFMSKPWADQAGCGSHYHVSLIDKRTRRNVFLDASKRNSMSDTMRHFTQGLMDHGAACMALFSPTPNCYHRLKPHTFAPSNVSWAIEDRSAMVRIKSVGEPSMHVENRVPSALANPYLSAAGTLACGLLGLKEKRRLQRTTAGPSEEDTTLPPLPKTLDAALDALEADKAVCKMLGEEFVTVFTTVKRYELARFREHITDWERTEYLEIY